MRILVTGGAGFIGSHIAHSMVERGHDVIVLDDLSTGRRENLPEGAQFVEGDLGSEDTLTAVFSGPRFDVISHQGAQTSVSVSTREPLLDAQTNVMGGLRLLGHAVRTEVPRFVFASTGGAIYGEVAEGERATTDWRPRPLSPYACSKLAFEGYLDAYRQTYGFSANVLRYANVYGPRQDPHGEAGVVAIFCGRILAGQPIQVNARAKQGDRGCVRDYVFVDDVVAANVAAAEGALEAPVLNVGTGLPTDTQRLAEVLLERGRARGSTTEMGFGPVRAGDLERSVLEPGAIPGRAEAVSLEDGLNETFDWFASR